VWTVVTEPVPVLSGVISARDGFGSEGDTLKTYGHLRGEHEAAMAEKVSF
jgi:hypothetical protein